jgi:ubiquitin C-terminal hydrolase
MFGLRNQKGSCWVNATIQSIFRIPEFQEKYHGNEHEPSLNPVERALEEIWVTKGEEGLRDLYATVKSKNLPAGENIGDSHELLDCFCDKIPFLDKLFRFKVANTIKCKSCGVSETRTDTLTEFSIAPSKPKMTLSEAIVESVQPTTIDDWACEKCKQKGCSKQLLLSTFPQVLTFHMTSVDTSVSYPPMLSLNKMKYALMSVVCFNGGHWWAYGRDMPPGKSWYEFDDMRVHEKDPSHFPLSDNARLLMYYRLKE